METWKDVIGYEGHYQVSDDGVVTSLKYGKRRVLKTDTNKKGYLIVFLTKNCKRKTTAVHLLVAQSFLNHKNDGTHKIVVDHINNIKSDNRVNNLQLISGRANSIKAKTDNTIKDKYTSNFIGVTLRKSGLWSASTKFKGRNIHLGYFKSEEEAANAYKKSASHLSEGYDLNVVYPKRVKSSSHAGVSFNKHSNKWALKIKGKHIGYFKTEAEAVHKKHKYINA